MPTYRYKCNNCNHSFEKFLKIANRSDPENNICPNCGEMRVKMVIGVPATIDEVVAGRLKPPKDFQNFLQKLHKNTPGSMINDRW